MVSIVMGQMNPIFYFMGLEQRGSQKAEQTADDEANDVDEWSKHQSI